jgi:hypothetical protein
MGPREKIEDFLRRHGYEGNRAPLVLVVVLAVLVALLLVRRLRVLRVLVLAVIGVIVVVGWLLVSPLLAPTPLLISHERGVVENGVAATAACGTEQGALAVLEHMPPSSMSTWGTEPKGTCVIRYPRPPEPEGALY